MIIGLKQEAMTFIFSALKKPNKPMDTGLSSSGMWIELTWPMAYASGLFLVPLDHFNVRSGWKTYSLSEGGSEAPQDLW